jgi:hypothetical protein
VISRKYLANKCNGVERDILVHSDSSGLLIVIFGVVDCNLLNISYQNKEIQRTTSARSIQRCRNSNDNNNW